MVHTAIDDYVSPVALIFRKQPSGGRGEYELSGESRGRDAGSLDNFKFVLRTPFGDKDTGLILSHQGAKRRLRREGDGMGMQIGRQAAALLLLPACTRTEDATSGAFPVILRKRYILDLQAELDEVESDVARLTPVAVIARSAGAGDERHTERVPIADRFDKMKAVLARRSEFTPAIRHALDTIYPLLIDSNVIMPPLEKAVEQLLTALESESATYLPGADPIPELGNLIGLMPAPSVPIPPDTPEDEPAIRLRAESILRAQRARGHSATIFRKNVQVAYDFRCLFCGLRAPAPRKGLSPGVDAAHILPWGKFDLDVVTNGMMLCKQHHWAFDNHLLVLEFRSAHYVLDLNLSGTVGYLDDKQTIAELSRVCGQIPQDRLPKKAAEHPDPQFLSLLYGSQ